MTAWLLALGLSVCQSGGHDAPMGPGISANYRPPELNGAGVSQRLGQTLPTDVPFRNESGTEVKLRDFLTGRPMILVLAYFKCPMLCSEVLNGLFDTLPKTGLAPDQYEVVVVSFDSREGPDLAAAKRRHYHEAFRQPGFADHVHFLTGSQESIDALTKAVGFGYGYDEKSDQFAHPGMITLVTPGGAIARYFFGIRFQPRDLRLGLVEASDGKIGTLTDSVILYCLYYDPNGATYAASIMRIVRLASAATVVVIVGLLFLARWKEKRQQRQATSAEIAAT